MILSISLARQAVYIDVTGCPCARGIAEDLMRRFADSGFYSYAAFLASTVSMSVSTPEPAVGEDRRTWTLKRACAVGLAATWALERGVVVAMDRREEPLADAAGVFDLKGWKADN